MAPRLLDPELADLRAAAPRVPTDPGNDPFIVMPSCNLERTVTTAVQARTINNGQSCIAAKRFIVMEKISGEFRDRLKQEVEKLKTMVEEKVEETGQTYAENASRKALAFSKASGKNIPVVFAERRAGDVACCYASPELARQTLGWQATKGLDFRGFLGESFKERLGAWHILFRHRLLA